MTQPTSPSPSWCPPPLLCYPPPPAIASVQWQLCKPWNWKTIRYFEWVDAHGCILYLLTCVLYLVSVLLVLFSWTNFENGSFFLYYSYNLYETIFQSFNRCMWPERPAAASEARPGARYQSCNVAFALRFPFPILCLLHCQSGRHIRYAAQSCFSFLCVLAF